MKGSLSGSLSMDTDDVRQHIMDNAIGKCPETTVVVGKEQVLMNCLVDTGAEVSTITESFFLEHWSQEDTLDTTHWMRIIAMDGLAVPYVGYVELDVNVLGRTIPSAGFLVVKEVEHQGAREKKERVPGLIGSNILRFVHDELTHSLGTTYLNDMSTLGDSGVWLGALSSYARNTCTQSPAGATETTTTTSQDDFLGPVKLTRGRPVRIPARTVKTLTGTAKPLSGEYSALMQQEDDSNLPRNLMIVRSYSTVKHGRLCVRVVNLGDEDVWLKPNARLGNLYAADVVDGEIVHDCVIRQISGHVLQVGERDSWNGTKREWTKEEVWPKGLNCDTSDFTPVQEQQFYQLLAKHKHAFSEGDHDLGYTTTVRHTIPLLDDVPVRLPHRRVPPNLQPEVQECLERWLKQGIIRPSSSPYASQAVLIRKRDGKIRICVDYRALNKKTRRDAYPLPRVGECLEALRQSRFFSSLDLALGYLQCAMDDADVPKTAFRVGSGGLYEFLRMPFGLSNCPASFQRLMETCLADLNMDILVVYLDDIMVHAQSFDDMITRLDQVFTRLEIHNLKLRPEKCFLFRKQAKYLGHIVSADGISTDPDKISAVRTWPTPQSDKELQTFMGLAGYYRRFVKNFAKLAYPLHAVVNSGPRKSSKKKARVDTETATLPFSERWTTDCDQAFEALKEALTSSPTLGFPNFEKPFILETDASFQGLGAVLSQDLEEGRRVIAFASRTLRPTERNMDNYSAMKLELLALKWAVADKFREYLMGSTFTVFTDNNPLCYLQTSKLGAVEMRWVSQLSQFNFSIQYRAGRQNRNADALSRRPSREEDISSIFTDLTGITTIPATLYRCCVKTISKTTQEEGVAQTTLPCLSGENIRQLQS